jgi:hypothetical protein
VDKLTTLCGRPVTLPSERIAEARRRFGQPFVAEPGSTFKWCPSPFVLSKWLQARKASR